MKVKGEYWVYHIILFKGCVFTGGLIKFVTVTLKKNLIPFGILSIVVKLSMYDKVM